MADEVPNSNHWWLFAPFVDADVFILQVAMVS